MKFLRSFLRPYFEDKPSVASRNVVRFLTVASGIFLNIMLANPIGNKGNIGNTRELRATRVTKGNKGNKG